MNAAASARLLQESLAVAEAGRRAEAEQRWEAALAQYERCVALFLQLIQTGALTAEQRTQLRATCAEYLDRAEASKRRLAAAASPATSPATSEAAQWTDVWRRVLLPDEGDRLLQCTWAKLEVPGQPTRRGRVFVSARRLCFAPHARDEKHAAAEPASFAAQEAVKLPVGAVLSASREAAYLGLSARIAVAAAGGTLLFRGLGDRRDAVFEALQWACEQHRARSRLFGAAPGLAVPRAVAAALGERLHEDWTAAAGDELLVRGAAAALDSGRQGGRCLFGSSSQFVTAASPTGARTGRARCCSCCCATCARRLLPSCRSTCCPRCSTPAARPASRWWRGCPRPPACCSASCPFSLPRWTRPARPRA